MDHPALPRESLLKELMGFVQEIQEILTAAEAIITRTKNIISIIADQFRNIVKRFGHLIVDLSIKYATHKCML